jgi:hypothetical protein
MTVETVEINIPRIGSAKQADSPDSRLNKNTWIQLASATKLEVER